MTISHCRCIVSTIYVVLMDVVLMRTAEISGVVQPYYHCSSSTSTAFYPFSSSTSTMLCITSVPLEFYNRCQCFSLLTICLHKVMSYCGVCEVCYSIIIFYCRISGVQLFNCVCMICILGVNTAPCSVCCDCLRSLNASPKSILKFAQVL